MNRLPAVADQSVRTSVGRCSHEQLDVLFDPGRDSPGGDRVRGGLQISRNIAGAPLVERAGPNCGFDPRRPARSAAATPIRTTPSCAASPGSNTQYTVAGRTYRGTRVSIGEDMGNFEVAETIARYPVGKAVTVYYNPNKREQAMLERDLPPGTFQGCHHLPGGPGRAGRRRRVRLRQAFNLGHQPGADNTSNAPFVTACLGFAAPASLFSSTRSKGTLPCNGPGQPQPAGSNPRACMNSSCATTMHGRLRTKYRADVAYSYEVAGVRYTQPSKLGSGEMSSNIERFARRIADRYPAGSTIEIHYNPANPAEAIVKPGGRALLLLWLILLAMVILAYIAAR